MINNNHHILHNTIIDASAHKWNSNDIINSAPPVHVHLPAIGLEIRRTSPFSQHFNGGRVSSTPLSRFKELYINSNEEHAGKCLSNNNNNNNLTPPTTHKVVLDGWTDASAHTSLTRKDLFIIIVMAP